MKMNPSQNRRPGLTAGFTLMELLVVIVIISVLASFMFPAARGVLGKAEKANAENTAHNLKSAISAYFTEYRKYPVSGATAGQDTEMESDHELMDVLLASEKEGKEGGLNPRRITYFSGKKAKPTAGGKYRSGVKLSSGGAGELWDPWSNYFQVTLDTDYNNRVKAPSFETEDAELPMTILVWSAGKDEQADEAKDNIKTW